MQRVFKDRLHCYKLRCSIVYMNEMKEEKNYVEKTEVVNLSFCKFFKFIENFDIDFFFSTG